MRVSTASGGMIRRYSGAGSARFAIVLHDLTGWGFWGLTQAYGAEIEHVFAANPLFGTGLDIHGERSIEEISGNMLAIPIGDVEVTYVARGAADISAEQAFYDMTVSFATLPVMREDMTESVRIVKLRQFLILSGQIAGRILGWNPGKAQGYRRGVAGLAIDLEVGVRLAGGPNPVAWDGHAEFLPESRMSRHHAEHIGAGIAAQVIQSWVHPVSGPKTRSEMRDFARQSLSEEMLTKVDLERAYLQQSFDISVLTEDLFGGDPAGFIAGAHAAALSGYRAGMEAEMLWRRNDPAIILEYPDGKRDYAMALSRIAGQLAMGNLEIAVLVVPIAA